MHPINESAASFKWLTKSLGTGDTSSGCNRSWQRVRDQMRGLSQSIMSSQDWISDFWICKTANASVIGLGFTGFGVCVFIYVLGVYFFLGSIPGIRRPTDALHGISYLDAYLPILMAFSLCMSTINVLPRSTIDPATLTSRSASKPD